VHKSPDPPRDAEPALAWDDVRYFLAVAREGSLSGAARALRVEHSTVARRVAGLEACVGVRLFDRLSRRWALTREGDALLAHAERLEHEALAFSRAALATTALQGRVRVSAPPTFAAHFLLPRLVKCAQAWPGIELDLVSEVRLSNLHRREADLAVRFMRPDEPGLSTRKLGELGFQLYAAPSWLQRPEADWCFLGYGPPLDEVPHQRLLAALAGTRPFVLRSNDLAALHQACVAGLGLAMLPRFLIRAGEGLVEVPGAPRPALREIWSVVHPDVRRSPRVRLMADLIAQTIRDHATALV